MALSARIFLPGSVAMDKDSFSLLTPTLSQTTPGPNRDTFAQDDTRTMHGPVHLESGALRLQRTFPPP